jgi:hypothetical protein
MVGMMGPISTAILGGCLQALKWLSWSIAGLLLVLIGVQSLRGDEGAQPLANVMVAIAFLGGGFVSGLASRAILKRAG